MGDIDSAHNKAKEKCEMLMNQNQYIRTTYARHSDKYRSNYRAHMIATIDCIRFLLKQGLAFRGHDESRDSSNRGNFLKLLCFLADHNEDINTIKKDIVSCVAIETTNIIIKEMSDVLFSILIDKSRDISANDQMVVVLHYVDKNGYVIERFIRIEHVTSTTSISLKEALDRLFSRHGLSMSRLRGQGYNGASNMQGEFNGLKALILEDNKYAYFIYCFAHQLQLALISVAKNHEEVNSLFNLVTMFVNVVGASAKRRDVLQEKHAEAVIKALDDGELSSGRGLNQEVTLKRSADTRWGSHYGTLLSIITMVPSIVDVLEIISNEGNSKQRFQAAKLLKCIQSFDFVFSLLLMKKILGFAHELSQALQKKKKKDQDILNAMKLIGVETSSYCVKHDIDVPNMDDLFRTQGRSQRKAQKVTNLHNFRVELFYAILEMQIQELSNRFNETNTELLLCVA
ncbi:hypothetical protein CISIN_1g0088141mg, partial [Citrus sinensis]